MKNIVFGIVAVLLLLVITSCDKKDQIAEPQIGDLDYFVFGHFYGKCGGEGCIEIYRLDGSSLMEDTTDVYPNAETAYDGKYIPLANEKFELVKDIVDFFPDSLYSETENIIGSPDAGDWGGVYVEIRYKEDAAKSGFWLLDQNSYNLPDVYNKFVTRINEKIILINQ